MFNNIHHQKLYQHLFEMELHGLPKHCYFDKKEDCIEHDGHLLKHFYLTGVLIKFTVTLSLLN